ncbi:hypothetical protein [uncultured Prevotella sp.]|uniref:hypothetical protein n=1 Tax=uncultured Prevotella sp. TaxID=159272 RepID=UPI0025E6AF9F|nr:hypothetical protein [uncultured Prevotella sp.]
MRPILKNILVALLLITFLILLPVILAPVLHLSHVDAYFDYGGKESDWITFWGNYLGAVITGLISFVILWYTIKSNKDENQAIINSNQKENTRIIQENQAENTRILEANADLEETKRKQEYYLRFRSEVSVRLSKMDLANFIGVYVDFSTPYREAKARLESFHGQLTEDLNSFIILYDGDCNELIQEYRKTVDIITEKIRDFLLLFKDMNDSSDQQVKLDKQIEIKKETAKLKDLKPVINDLWSNAKLEIDKLKI